MDSLVLLFVKLEANFFKAFSLLSLFETLYPNPEVGNCVAVLLFFPMYLIFPDILFNIIHSKHIKIS